MPSLLAQEIGLEVPDPPKKPDDTPNPPNDTPNPLTEPVQLSEEEQDKITLERINRKRGTDFKTLDEALTAPIQPEPAESEEEKKKKRENEKIQFALSNNIVSAKDLEDYHKDSAKEARDLVYADFFAKHSKDGKSEQWIQKTFTKLYGEDLEDEDENDDVTPAVKAEHQERLKKDANKLLRNKYPAIHNLDQQYDSHLTRIKKEEESNKIATKVANQYASDVAAFFSNVAPLKLKVGGEEGKPETDFETDFIIPKDILDKIKNEVLDKEVVLRNIGNYSKDILYNYINGRLREETFAASNGHLAKKYHEYRDSKKNIKRKELGGEIISGGQPPEGYKPSKLAQATGIAAEIMQ
jgi:hypothetical protein